MRHVAVSLLRSVHMRTGAWPSVLLAGMLALSLLALSASASPIASTGINASASVAATGVSASPLQDDRAPDETERPEFHAKKRRLVAPKIETTGNDDTRHAAVRAPGLPHPSTLPQVATARLPATQALAGQASDTAPREIPAQRMPPGQAPPRA